MTATSYKRGHKIYYNEEKKEWLYLDDDTPATIERPCVKCGQMPTPEGYDFCTGKVPGATSVCCGHGITNPILIKKEDKL